MAETTKAATVSVPAGEPTTVEPSKNASVLVQVAYPVTNLHIDGLPVITQAGTMLTQTQVKEAEASLKRSNSSARLIVGDGSEGGAE